MAKNLENINTVRKANGLAPLDKLPEEKDADINTSGPPASSDPPPAGGTANQPPASSDPPAPVTDIDLDDEKILAALKKKGITVGSIEELVPKVDPALAVEKREVDKLSYSLGKGLYSLKEHENFVREKNNPRDLVFAAFYDEAKADDSTLTNEDIQAEFEEKYGINAEPGSRKFKRGAEEINLLADKILKDRYKKIYAADEAYQKHESTENDKQTRSRTILAKAPAYKKDVEDVFQALKTVKIPISDAESYDVEVPEAALNSVKALFLDPDNAAKEILKGYTPDSIREVAYTALLRENFATLFLEGAKQYHLKRQKGVKGIPPTGPQVRTNTRVLSENQRKVLAEHGISEDDLPPPTVN